MRRIELMHFQVTIYIDGQHKKGTTEIAIMENSITIGEKINALRSYFGFVQDVNHQNQAQIEWCERQTKRIEGYLEQFLKIQEQREGLSVSAAPAPVQVPAPVQATRPIPKSWIRIMGQEAAKRKWDLHLLRQEQAAKCQESQRPKEDTTNDEIHAHIIVVQDELDELQVRYNKCEVDSEDARHLSYQMDLKEQQLEDLHERLNSSKPDTSRDEEFARLIQAQEEAQAAQSASGAARGVPAAARGIPAAARGFPAAARGVPAAARGATSTYEAEKESVERIFANASAKRRNKK